MESCTKRTTASRVNRNSSADSPLFVSVRPVRTAKRSFSSSARVSSSSLVSSLVTLNIPPYSSSSESAIVSSLLLRLSSSMSIASTSALLASLTISTRDEQEPERFLLERVHPPLNESHSLHGWVGVDGVSHSRRMVYAL